MMFARNQATLSDNEIARIAPSVFATAAHESRSERYTYVPTSDVLAGLRREGFEVFAASQSRSRIEGKAEFTKHCLRLRPAGSSRVAADVSEVVLVNSHDGTSSYQMMEGVYRQVCSNGMIAYTETGGVRIPHKGDIIGRVIEGAFTVVDNFEDTRNRIESMKAVTLAPAEQLAFATAAIETRWDTSEAPAPVEPARLLSARRFEDKASDLWTTFNRVQENVIKGGLRGRSTTGRRMSTRQVTGIDSDIKINRALWMLAEQMKALKA